MRGYKEISGLVGETGGSKVVNAISEKGAIAVINGQFLYFPDRENKGGSGAFGPRKVLRCFPSVACGPQ